MSDRPQSFPTEIAIGETIVWEKDFDDYPAASDGSGWTVTYYIRGQNGPGVDVVGTPSDLDGTIHVFTVSASASANLIAGRYDFQALAVKGSEKYRVDEGDAKAVASLAAVISSSSYDGRSPAKKILDAIDALMAGKATVDQQEYMIGAGGSQRMLKKIDPVALLEIRKYYARIVRRENRRGRGNVITYAQFDPA
ncbi:MAG: hypothetical protein ABJB61_15125 [bacterium]